MIALYGLSVVDRRELIDGHTLSAVAIQPGKRPSKHNVCLAVWCSCGQRLTLSIPSQARSAMNMAERNHRIEIGWPIVAHWHGTPNGYVNQDCRCDPCRWAWASYRRGDDPVEAAPVWFDEWACSAGAL